MFGLGGIGLNVIQGARMVGADRIVGIDVNPAKRAMAEKFGMTDFINPTKSGAIRSCKRSSISLAAEPTFRSTAPATFT